MTEQKIETREREIIKLKEKDALKDLIEKTKMDIIRAQDLVDYNIKEISKLEKEVREEDGAVEAENKRTSKSNSINSICNKVNTKEYTLKRKHTGKESWEQKVTNLTKK